jgi:hypothetical protein
VELWRNGKQTQTVEEEIPFDIEKVQDSAHDIGYKELKTPGENGKKTVTYELVMKNGKETGRTIIQSVETKKAVKQVEVIGTKTRIVPYTGGGSKTEWLRASGISEENWGYADYIITGESHWNPNAINPNSGACGLAQAYPCGKVPGNPLDPVDSLRWANGYVNKFGGWAGAYEHWQKYKSY